MATAVMLKVYKNFIDGEWVEARSGKAVENRNPANTEELVGMFPASTEEDVNLAVEAAREAYKGWRLVPAPKRAEILFRAAELLVARKEDFAHDMTREMGKVLAETRGDVQEAIDMTYYMAGPVGENVQIRYVRNKQGHDVQLTVADRSKIFPQTAGNQEEGPGDAEPVQFGLHVEDLNPEIARRLGMEKYQGVVVTEVDPASFAEDIGFARGDVILEVNHVNVASLSDYRREMGKLKAGQDVLFKVARRADSERVLTLFLAGAVPAGQ